MPQMQFSTTCLLYALFLINRSHYHSWDVKNQRRCVRYVVQSQNAWQNLDLPYL